VVTDGVHCALNTVGVLGSKSRVEKEFGEIILCVESELGSGSAGAEIARRECNRAFSVAGANEVQRTFVIHTSDLLGSP